PGARLVPHLVEAIFVERRGQSPPRLEPRVVHLREHHQQCGNTTHLLEGHDRDLVSWLDTQNLLGLSGKVSDLVVEANRTSHRAKTALAAILFRPDQVL